MRIAALYDIHGNLPALEAVLQDITRTNVEQIVVGGDVVAGPMPRETLDCLLNLPIPVQFLQGNADREVVAQMAGNTAGAVPEHVREITRWLASNHPDRDTWPRPGALLPCHPAQRHPAFYPLDP